MSRSTADAIDTVVRKNALLKARLERILKEVPCANCGIARNVHDVRGSGQRRTTAPHKMPTWLAAALADTPPVEAHGSEDVSPPASRDRRSR
jgi:hypothetical protein